MSGKSKRIEAKAKAAPAKVRADNRFRNLLEAAPDGILEVDREGNILLLNHAAEKMFGYSRDELLGLKVEALVPEASRGQHASHRNTYAAQPRVRPMGSGLELKARRKDGSSFPVEISLSPNMVDGDFHVIALIRDITDRKQAEDRIRAIREEYAAQLAAKNQELELRNREVEKANNLKSEFMASMSHELRTPLHTIIGFTELLAEQIEGPLNEKQQRFLGHVLQDSRHLLQLINDVLDLSKIEAGQLTLEVASFDFAECVQEVVASIDQQAAAKHIHVERKSMYNGAVCADRLRLKEVLYNLLSNAVKFTPDEGSVWIESSTSDGWLKITVGDTGIGIPAQEHENVFEKFYQVAASSGLRKGTGLGLPITKKLVEMHGGHISVNSRPDQGSEFAATIPLTGPRPCAAGRSGDL